MLVLTTERLRLRWFRDDDAPWLRVLVNDPSWLQNIGDRGVHDDAAALAYVRDRLGGGYWRDGFGFWLVERVSDGERLGMCGITQRDRLPDPDLGFAFLPAFHGHGYAYEAAAATLRYATTTLGLHTVLATTAPHNRRSAHLLGKLGMHPDPAAPREDDDGPAVRYVWHAPSGAPAAGDDDAAIDDVVRRFFAAFDQRGPQPPLLPALPRWCTPDATFRRVAADAASGGTVEDLRTFVRARAELFGGTLAEFHEHEVAQRTERHGALASRWSRYAKAGRRAGQPFTGGGHKALHLVRGARGWRIAAVAWQDDPEP